MNNTLKKMSNLVIDSNRFKEKMGHCNVSYLALRRAI